MDFLLNNQVEIILLNITKDREGNFTEKEESLGFFFAQVNEVKRRNKVYLNISIRKNPCIKENFKVIFNSEEYAVISFFEMQNSFISIKCERKKI